MSVLKDFKIALPEQVGGCAPIITAKVKIPEGSEIGWKTILHFSDGVQCFMTIDRKYVPAQNARSIEESYTAYTGKTFGFFSRPKNTEFTLYAYPSIIAGCSIGMRLPFTDVEDGEKKNLSTYWEYSLSVIEPRMLVNEASIAPDGVITTDTCSSTFRTRGNLSGIIEQVILTKLKTVPFSEIRAHTADISEEIKQKFIEHGLFETTGFNLMSFVLGDIRIVDDNF